MHTNNVYFRVYTIDKIHRVVAFLSFACVLHKCLENHFHMYAINFPNPIVVMSAQLYNHMGHINSPKQSIAWHNMSHQ